MANISLAFANQLSPGTRVVETTGGARVLPLASFSTVYMVGSSTTGDYLKPVQVTSLTDFTNVFGSSPSEDSVKLFFRNNRRGILYFVRTPIAERTEVTVTTSEIGDYVLTIEGTDITVSHSDGATTTSLAEDLIEAINLSSVSSAVNASAGTAPNKFYIRAKDPLNPLTVVVADGAMTTVAANPTAPLANDYVYAIGNTFDYEDDWEQGFLIAPEAFQLLPQSGRVSVGTAMHDLAADENFDWVAIADCGDEVLTIDQSSTDGQLYTTPQGHIWYYFPYVIDLEDQVVPPSAGVVGVATRRFSEQGFHQPAAGAKFPLQGVKDVRVRVNTQQQGTLNPLGINVIRNLRNKGVCIWGMRTRSSNSFYTQGVGRVIMNVLNGTLRRGFDNDLFNSIDGEGVSLHLIEQAANSVCNVLWRGKALFGAEEEQAFEVRCNFENNIPENLDQGNVLVEVWVATSPATEKILINTIKVPINQVQTAAANGTV